MRRLRLELPLAVQIGAVVVLFGAALGTLWYTSSRVVEREQRRARANERLREANDQLEALGRDAIAGVRPFPDFMDASDWSTLNRRLSDDAARIRERHPGIEGGYYLPSRPDQPFLPDLPRVASDHETGEGSGPAAHSVSPNRQSLYDYVDTQVDAAFRKKTVLSVVEDIAPYTLSLIHI